MKKYLIVLIFIFQGCDLLENKPDQVIARLNDEFLYNSDLVEKLPKNISKVDSILFAKNFIDNWAKNKLLYNQALINLDQTEQDEINKLIESYKNDLYSFNYKEKIVKALMDTIVPDTSLTLYYDQNKSNFKLNQDIVKAKYLKISKNNYNNKDIIKRFRRFNKNDLEFLDSISLQFSSFYFNDSVWVNKSLFFTKFPELNERLKRNIVKNKLFYKFEDSLELYLISIRDSKFKNEIAPYSFIKTTINQVLINKKKLEFISKFEKELIEDAILKNEFEFYENNK